MTHGYMKLLHLGSKALTSLSSQPVSHEPVGMTYLQTASRQLTGWPIKELHQEELQEKRSSQHGGLELAAGQSLFQMYVLL